MRTCRKSLGSFVAPCRKLCRIASKALSPCAESFVANVLCRMGDSLLRRRGFPCGIFAQVPNFVNDIKVVRQRKRIALVIIKRYVVMKANNFGLAFFLSLFLSCVALTANAKDNVTVGKGMTKRQVLEILGSPEDRNFDQYGERWEYVKSGGAFRYDKRIVVGFGPDGKVVSYHSVTFRHGNESKNIKDEGTAPVVEVPVPACPYGVFAMDGQAFSVLYNKVRGASFDSNKFDLIEVASLGGYYTCGQCAKMMGLFTFDDDRLKVFGFMAPHVVDPENAIDVYRLLDFDGSKEKAQRMMRGR